MKAEKPALRVLILSTHLLRKKNLHFFFLVSDSASAKRSYQLGPLYQQCCAESQLIFIRLILRTGAWRLAGREGAVGSGEILKRRCRPFPQAGMRHRGLLNLNSSKASSFPLSSFLSQIDQHSLRYVNSCRCCSVF